jgi:hypothetical protein
MNPKKYLLVSLAIIMLLGCDGVDEVTNADVQHHYSGYRPVYGSQELSAISLTDPQSIKNPGKIYVYGKYLLINDIKEGIHIYDNSNVQAPVAIGFIRMLGNSDMAIKNNVLYGDHLGNVVALSIGDFDTIVEKGRLKLADWNLGIPPPSGHYFECVDASKGLVTGWRESENENLKCYAL